MSWRSNYICNPAHELLTILCARGVELTFVGLRQFFAQEAVKRELDLATVVGWPIPDAVRLLTDGAAAGGKSGGGKTPTKAPAGKKPSINARMLETIQKDTAAMGWNSPKWARYLSAAKSSVTDTQAWQDLKMGRERVKAQRALDRRRRPRGSDLNRG